MIRRTDKSGKVENIEKNPVSDQQQETFVTCQKLVQLLSKNLQPGIKQNSADRLLAGSEVL